VSPVGTTQDPSVPRLQRSMLLGAMIPWGRAEGCDVPPLRGSRGVSFTSRRQGRRRH
jgi:hypothetical protein